MVKHANLKKMPPKVRELDRLLRTHSGELWHPYYDPKRGPKLDIYDATFLLRLIGVSLNAGDFSDVPAMVDIIPLFDQLLENPRYAGHQKHMTNFKNAVERQRWEKAFLHITRVLKIVHPVAADQVFEDNQHVAIIRTEHGWYDGSLSGRVVPGSGGYQVEDDDGNVHDIMHLRDIH